LRRCRPGGDAARAAVKAHVAPVVYDYGLVVDIGDVHAGDVRHSTVVEEVSAAPLAAQIPDAPVTEAVTDAAVEADGGSPVAFVPYK